MEIIATYGTVFLIIAVVFGLYMTWGIGANDVANVMGTSVGSGAITVTGAIIIAAIFEFGGAALAGGHVTATIRKGIIDPGPIVGNPEILVFGMLAALLAAAIWLMFASSRGWPVSTTHSIVGAIVGFAMAGIGLDAVKWDKIGQIVASWIVSPAVGGTVAFLLMLSIRRFILDTDDPFRNAKRWGPVYVFLVGFVIALVTLFKGLKHLKLDLSIPMSFLLAAIIGLIVAAVGWALISRVKVDEEADKEHHFASVEKVFVPMMLFTACGMAFAHGSNDVANGRSPGGGLRVGAVGRRACAKIADADLDPVVGWRRHRRRPGDIRLQGDAHHRHQDHRTDADAWILCHDGGGNGRFGLPDGDAGLNHAHCRGRGDGCRSCPRYRRDRPARHRRDSRLLDCDAAGRRHPRGAVLLHVEGDVYLIS